MPNVINEGFLQRHFLVCVTDFLHRACCSIKGLLSAYYRIERAATHWKSTSSSMLSDSSMDWHSIDVAITLVCLSGWDSFEVVPNTT